MAKYKDLHYLIFRIWPDLETLITDFSVPCQQHHHEG